MRSNRTFRSHVTTNRSKVSTKVNVPAHQVVSGQCVHGLFTSLNKLYIRNFYEYHSRSRSSESKLINSINHVHDRTRRPIHIDHDQQTADQVSMATSASKSSGSNDDDRTCGPLTRINRANHVDVDNVISATVAASALMRRNRYSTKGFLTRSVLNENKLKKSKEKRKQLHSHRMVAAYKVEWKQDNYDRLQNQFDMLAHKTKIINRECKLLGRDLEQMKSDYTCVYNHVVKKDDLLKEQDKMRFLNNIPNLESFEHDLNKENNKLTGKHSDQINGVDVISNQLLDINGNLIDCKTNHDPIDTLEHVNSKMADNNVIEPMFKDEHNQAHELLWNCLKQEGNEYLRDKIHQLIDDNKRLKQFKSKLNQLLIDFKFNQIKLKSETKANADNVSGQVSNVDLNRNCLNVHTFGTVLNRKNRHTINLPNRKIWEQNQQKRKNKSIHMDAYAGGGGSIENLNRIRNEIRQDEQNLENGHLRKTETYLTDELKLIENDLKDKHLHQQVLHKEINCIQSKLNEQFKRIDELKCENTNLKKRMQQLQQ